VFSAAGDDGRRSHDKRKMSCADYQATEFHGKVRNKLISNAFFTRQPYQFDMFSANFVHRFLNSLVLRANRARQIRLTNLSNSSPISAICMAG
jgi:CelD/BcsL family acetyltransferase involved in cellulose biosynthesis